MATWLGVVRCRQLSFLDINIMWNMRKQMVCNRNYYRKVRRKEKSIAECKIDIDGILSDSGSVGPSKVAPSSTAVNKSSKDSEAIKVWQSSDERTALLRKGEKRVAIIAVATMLIGFVAIKSIVYVSEKWKTPSDIPVDQPP